METQSYPNTVVLIWFEAGSNPPAKDKDSIGQYYDLLAVVLEKNSTKRAYKRCEFSPDRVHTLV